MNLSKDFYALVADAIYRGRYPDSECDSWVEPIIGNLVKTFKSSNPSFDSKHFIIMCGSNPNNYFEI